MKFPNEWAMLKAAAANNIRREFSGWDSILERKALSFDKMKNLLDKPEWVDKVRTLFGDEYVGNLEMIRNAAAIQGRTPGKVIPDLENKFVNLIRNVAFGPLSHRNFIIKKVTKFKHGMQMDNLMDMILDPTLLNAAARDMHTPDGMKTLQVLLGAGGAQVAAEEPVDASFTSIPQFQDLQNAVKDNPDLQRKILDAIR